MSRSRSLADMLTEYHTGLEAELQLLVELKRLSHAQSHAGHAREVARLTEIGAARDELMDAVLAIEERIKPLRQALAARRDETATLPGYRQTITLHKQAEALVVEIAEHDRQTVAALEEVESTRRLAYEMINRGQTSLEGYRRVVLPESLPAALFNRRG